MRAILAFLFPLAFLTGIAAAEPHKLAIPLRDSQLQIGDLAAALTQELHIPLTVDTSARIDMASVAGSNFVVAINGALGDGCQISVCDEQLILLLDPDKLPHGCYAAEQSLRIFTALMTPEATALQMRSYGLLLPRHVDENKPLVLLVRGLDADCCGWDEIASRLENAGYQVGRFNYPDDAPIADNAQLLGQHIAALHETFPNVHLDIITHSMGALIARGWIEGDGYTGCIDHLIMLAPPNHGSTWTKYRFFLEAQKQYEMCRHDPNWHASWFITEGVGSAARDLKPNSDFLTQLNDRPRRAGVKYTIIAGNRHPGWELAANLVSDSCHLLPASLSQSWLGREANRQLQSAASSMRNHESKDDGPVTLESAKLDGVDDFVVIPADHLDIYCGKEPLAWPIIKDRLKP